MQNKAKAEKGVLDILGMGASIACALHCSILPILLAYSAFTGLAWMRGHAVEMGFILAAALIAVPAFRAGYKDHGRWYPAVICVLGFVLILYSSAHHDHSVSTPLLLPTMAGLLLASAHFMNLRLRRHS